MHTNIQIVPSVEVVTLTKTAFELLVNRIQLLEQRFSHSEEKILYDQLFTQEQVESMFGVSRATLKRYRNQGQIRGKSGISSLVRQSGFARVTFRNFKTVLGKDKESHVDYKRTSDHLYPIDKP